LSLNDPGPLSSECYAKLATPLPGVTVRLLPLAEQHVDSLHSAFREDDLWTWQGKQPETLAETRLWVESALSLAQSPASEVPFIFESHDGRLAGTTRYMDIRWNDSALEIGWTMVFAPFRRTSVNTEVKYLLLKRAFEEVGCGRVQLKTDALNLRSRAAILRIGAKFEGVHRCHKRRADGTLRDTAFFSITYQEWPEVKLHLESLLHRGQQV
jgi:RimJ/RimL family protein N-acetyltransferase